MVSAYYVPLWQILMWAPQYPEGLDMKIWIDNLTGDVKIISALNHYIGMRAIEPSAIPELRYMPWIVAALIGLGVLAAVVGRRRLLVAWVVAFAATGAAGMYDFWRWGYDYGHDLDPHAIIRAARRRGVIVNALHDYYVGQPDRGGLLLGYGGLTSEEVERGARVLVQAIRGTA